MNKRQFANSLIQHGHGDPIELLNTFQIYAQHGNGVRVAKKVLFCTPAAIYYRLKRLERLLDEPLVIKGRLDHTGLTPAGKELFDKLQAMD